MSRPWRSLLLLFAMPLAMLALKHGGNIAKSPVEDAADFLMDAKMQVQQMDDLRNEVEELAPKIETGEDEAKSAFTFCCRRACPRSLYADEHLRDSLT
jgi:hypothetical protein